MPARSSPCARARGERRPPVTDRAAAPPFARPRNWTSAASRCWPSASRRIWTLRRCGACASNCSVATPSAATRPTPCSEIERTRPECLEWSEFFRRYDPRLPAVAAAPERHAQRAESRVADGPGRLHSRRWRRSLCSSPCSRRRTGRPAGIWPPFSRAARAGRLEIARAA